MGENRKQKRKHNLYTYVNYIRLDGKWRHFKVIGAGTVEIERSWQATANVWRQKLSVDVVIPPAENCNTLGMLRVHRQRRSVRRRNGRRSRRRRQSRSNVYVYNRWPVPAASRRRQVSNRPILHSFYVTVSWVYMASVFYIYRSHLLCWGQTRNG